MAPGEPSLARMAAMHRRFVLLLLCLVTALGGAGADSDDGPDPVALPCTDCYPDGGGGDGGVVYPTDEDGSPTSPSPWGDASSKTSPAATTPGPTEPYAPAVEYTIRTGKINITVNGTRTSLRVSGADSERRPDFSPGSAPCLWPQPSPLYFRRCMFRCLPFMVPICDVTTRIIDYQRKFGSCISAWKLTV